MSKRRRRQQQGEVRHITTPQNNRESSFALNEPLLPNPSKFVIVDEETEPSEDSSQFSRDCEEDSVSYDIENPPVSINDAVKAALVFLVAIAGVSASASAMIALPATTVYIAGGLCSAVAPFVCYREAKLVTVPGVRKIISWLRVEGNRLIIENNKLSTAVDELEEQIVRTEEVQNKLVAITERQGEKVETLVGLVNENNSLLRSMWDVQKKIAVHDVTSIVLTADRSHDFHMSDDDLRGLAMRMHHQLLTHGVHLNVPKFTNAVQKSDRSLDGVLKICIDFLENHEAAELPQDYHGDFDFDEDEDDMFAFESRASNRGSVIEENAAQMQQILETLGEEIDEDY